MYYLVWHTCQLQIIAKFTLINLFCSLCIYLRMIVCLKVLNSRSGKFGLILILFFLFLMCSFLCGLWIQLFINRYFEIILKFSFTGVSGKVFTRLLVFQPPPVLVLQLNRFKMVHNKEAISIVVFLFSFLHLFNIFFFYNLSIFLQNEFFKPTKITKQVEYPKQLDMAKFCSIACTCPVSIQQNKICNYNLYISKPRLEIWKWIWYSRIKINQSK